MNGEGNLALARRIIEAATSDNRARIDHLLPAVYDHLRVVARGMLKRERSATTIQATALVNEAFARLVAGGDFGPSDRLHLLRSLVRRMRWILIERARRPKLVASMDEELELVETGAERDAEDLEALDRALEDLRRVDELAADVIDARFHLQWSDSQIAEALGVGEATVRRRLVFAKAWLRTEME